MNFILRNIKRVIRLFYCLSFINWFRFCKNYSTKEGVVVVIPGLLRNFFINSLELDIMNIAALLSLDQKIKIHIGINFSQYQNRKICYNPSDLFNNSKNLSNAEAIAAIVKVAEQNGNHVFLSSKEIILWENKEYMHNLFEELAIPTPYSKIASTDNLPHEINLEFPLLIKELHSHASLGVHKIESLEHLKSTFSNSTFKERNEKVIIQQLLNIRKDLRVILCGNEVLLHYWRINKSDTWKPTSTSHGSGVDFENFPEKWRAFIIEQFLKLKITTGAFDIAWQNDDLDTQPYFLEVSPSYQPNPPVDLTNKNYSYGQYKKMFLLFNSWDSQYLKTVFLIKKKVYTTWLKNESLKIFYN